MISFLLLLLFLAAAVVFGLAFSSCLLKERRVVALVALAPLLGINGYVFFVNLISYFVPVRVSFWLVLLLMLVASAIIYMLFGKRTEAVSAGVELSSRQLMFLFSAAAFVSLTAGVVGLRTLIPDDLFPGHLPLAATISQGNFPVMDPSEPDYPMAYHYGPDLLTAALHNVAGIPLWLSYDVQTIIFSAATFLLAFVVALYLTNGFRASFIAAFLLLYGGGLSWLNGVNGITSIWRKFVVGEEVHAPWKFLAEMTIPNFDSSLATSLNHSTLMGFAVMLLAIYLFFRALEEQRRNGIFLAVTSGLLLGYTALSLETNFVIVVAVLFVYGAGMAFYQAYYKQGGADFLIRTALVIAVGATLALSQGGILSTLARSGEHQSFTVVKNFWTSDITNKGVLPFRMKFFQEFGLPLMLFIPAVVFFRRDKKIIFLALVAAGAFVAPLAIHYAPRPHEMERLFALSTPLFSFTTGLFLGNLSARSSAGGTSKYINYLVLAAIAAVTLTALSFQAVHIITPVGYIGQLDRPFFDVPPAPSPIDQRAYEWIARRTALSNRFFPYSIDFMRDTGRFTPGPFAFDWGRRVKETYREAADSCASSAFQKLGVSHLYLLPDFPLENFYPDCLMKLGAKLVYAEEQGSDFRRIYELPKQ